MTEIVAVPPKVDSLPFPTLADKPAGTYNLKAYNWAERHPLVADAINAQALATHTNATAAKERADAAAASATAAAGSATTAAGYVTTVAGSATAAANSATAASGSATTAGQKSTLATNEANRAKTEADRAATIAGALDPTYVLQRENHSGVQAINTITGLQTALDEKVVKVTGKGLSTNDYNATEKAKVAAAMPAAGGTFSGNVTIANATTVGAAGRAGLQLGAGTSGPAVMSFHNGGYAINFGLDTDNIIRLGGWSQGAGAYRWTCDSAGNSTNPGNVTAYSDARLKTNLRPIKDALAKLLSLQGLIYTRTDTGQEQTGILAQDLQKVLPQAVMIGEDENETLSVAYGNTLGLVVEAIREISNKLDQLIEG